MQDSFFLSAHISDATKSRMLKIVESPTDNFDILVTLSGLNPKRSFRYSNLQGVNFDNADLRGFDFTGATLVGAKGRNVQWDHTTILLDADVNDSLFASGHKEAEYGLPPNLARKHWTEIIIWMDELLSHETDFRENGRILLHLFSTFSDSFVRRRALQVLAKRQNLKTMLGLISENVFSSDDRKLVPVAFKILNELFVAHPEEVTAFVIKQLRGRWALNAATFLAQHLKGKRLGMLVNLMSRNESPLIRKQFIAALLERVGEVKATVSRSPLTGDVYDFGETVTPLEVALLSRIVNGKVRQELEESPYQGAYYAAFIRKPMSTDDNILNVMAELNQFGFDWRLPMSKDVAKARNRRISNMMPPLVVS